VQPEACAVKERHASACRRAPQWRGAEDCPSRRESRVTIRSRDTEIEGGGAHNPG